MSDVVYRGFCCAFLLLHSKHLAAESFRTPVLLLASVAMGPKAGLICAAVHISGESTAEREKLTGQLSQVQPVPQLQEPELEHPQLPILMICLRLWLEVFTWCYSLM